MKFKSMISKGLLVTTIASSLTPLTTFADSSNLNTDLTKSEYYKEVNDEPIVIELNAADIIKDLDEYGIDENSTDQEIDIAIESIIASKPSPLAHAVHGGAGLPSKPYIGQTDKVIIKISNNDILAISGITSISKTVLTKAFKSLTAYFVPFAKFTALAGEVAAVNAATGYKGFQYTVNMTYKTSTIFDGQHVSHTGWHVTGYSGFKRYK